MVLIKESFHVTWRKKLENKTVLPSIKLKWKWNARSTKIIWGILKQENHTYTQLTIGDILEQYAFMPAKNVDNQFVNYIKTKNLQMHPGNMILVNI